MNKKHNIRMVMMVDWSGEDYGASEDIIFLVSDSPIDVEAIAKRIEAQSRKGLDNGIPAHCDFEVDSWESVAPEVVEEAVRNAIDGIECDIHVIDIDAKDAVHFSSLMGEVHDCPPDGWAW